MRFFYYVFLLNFIIFVDIAGSVNDSPARNINAQLIAGIVHSPDAVIIGRNLDRLQVTPGDSISSIARSVVTSIMGDLMDAAGSPEVQNNQLFESFSSPDKSRKRRALVLDNAARRLSDSERDTISVVDTEHVTRPRITRHKVSGGHWIQNYAIGQVSKQCFLGQDKHTLGVFAGVIHYPKTVRRNFDSSIVLSALRGSVQVAKDRKFIISRTADNTFISSFRNESHVLKVDTLFPILVVQPYNRNDDNTITLGSFGELTPDYNNILNRKEARVTPSEYNNMMRRGTRLETAPGSPVMVDITRPFQNLFFADLRDRHFFNDHLPGKLYGYDYAR